MLRINEILDAVEELVQERFPDSKAYRNQVPKNFKRSSFMVSIGPQTCGHLLTVVTGGSDGSGGRVPVRGRGCYTQLPGGGAE